MPEGQTLSICYRSQKNYWLKPQKNRCCDKLVHMQLAGLMTFYSKIWPWKFIHSVFLRSWGNQLFRLNCSRRALLRLTGVWKLEQCENWKFWNRCRSTREFDFVFLSWWCQEMCEWRGDTAKTFFFFFLLLTIFQARTVMQAMSLVISRKLSYAITWKGKR